MLGRMFSTRHHINVVKHASKMWCPREIQPESGSNSASFGIDASIRGSGAINGNKESGGRGLSGRQIKKGFMSSRDITGSNAISSMLAGDGGAGERGGIEMRLRGVEAMLAQTLRQNSDLVLENDGLRVRMASIEEQMAKAIAREGILTGTR